MFPDATLKLFITATPRTRAERRVAEIGGDIDDVATSIAERDRRDMTRADGPLRAADGAVVVDTTGLTIDEVVARIVELSCVASRCCRSQSATEARWRRSLAWLGTS